MKAATLYIIYITCHQSSQSQPELDGSQIARQVGHQVHAKNMCYSLSFSPCLWGKREQPVLHAGLSVPPRRPEQRASLVGKYSVNDPAGPFSA